MTIENRKAFDAALWDWGILLGAFPRRVTPSDIDGHTEIGGCHLFIECKGPGVPVPEDGQYISLARLAFHAVNTVVYVWGKPNCPTHYQVIGFPIQACTLESFREFCVHWSKWADGGTKRTRYSPPVPSVPKLAVVRDTPSGGPDLRQFEDAPPEDTSVGPFSDPSEAFDQDVAF